MTVYIPLGWWLLPLLITLLSPAIVIWQTNEAARSSDGFGVFVGGIVLVFWAMIAVIVSLASWLLWALL